MKIDKNLNLVLPILTDAGTAYVHSTPVAYDVFREHWRILSKTFESIYRDTGDLSGPRVAWFTMMDIAKLDGEAAAKTFAQTFWNEVIRLTNVVLPTEANGYETLPFDTVIKRGLFDLREVDEAQNAIAFFTVMWHMHKAKDRAVYLQMPLKSWDGQLDSSNVTEFMSSLPILTPTVATGATVEPSSIPS